MNGGREFNLQWSFYDFIAYIVPGFLLFVLLSPLSKYYSILEIFFPFNISESGWLLPLYFFVFGALLHSLNSLPKKCQDKLYFEFFWSFLKVQREEERVFQTPAEYLPSFFSKNSSVAESFWNIIEARGIKIEKEAIEVAFYYARNTLHSGRSISDIHNRKKTMFQGISFALAVSAWSHLIVILLTFLIIALSNLIALFNLPIKIALSNLPSKSIVASLFFFFLCSFFSFLTSSRAGFFNKLYVEATILSFINENR